MGRSSWSQSPLATCPTRAVSRPLATRPYWELRQASGWRDRNSCADPIATERSAANRARERPSGGRRARKWQEGPPRRIPCRVHWREGSKPGRVARCCETVRRNRREPPVPAARITTGRALEDLSRVSPWNLHAFLLLLVEEL